MSDDTFLLFVNAWNEPVGFTLPPSEWAGSWSRVVDTATGQCQPASETLQAGEELAVEGRSLVLLLRTA